MSCFTLGTLLVSRLHGAHYVEFHVRLSRSDTSRLTGITIFASLSTVFPRYMTMPFSMRAMQESLCCIQCLAPYKSNTALLHLNYICTFFKLKNQITSVVLGHCSLCLVWQCSLRSSRSCNQSRHFASAKLIRRCRTRIDHWGLQNSRRSW